MPRPAARASRAELHDRIRAATRLGRIGQPEDAAELVASLCSPRGGWITGQVIASDGGGRIGLSIRQGREPLG